MTDPSAARAHLPAGYGLPVDAAQLSWADVEARLRSAPHHWIGTVGDDGVSIVRPIDGMWLDRAVYFGGDPAARWHRNLRVNARASVHLEDAERAVIVEGEVRMIRPDHDLAVRLADASNAKYAMDQAVSDYEGQELGELRAHVVLAWKRPVRGRDALRPRLVMHGVRARCGDIGSTMPKAGASM